MERKLDFQPVVLSAEDDENAQFLLKRAFKAGVKALLTHVKDGYEAICYFSGEGDYANREIYPLPQLLMLDLKMPRVNGFEVLEYLRGQPAFRNLPVVVFSSSIRHEDVRKAHGLGGTAYVVKPADFTMMVELAKAIETEFLGGRTREGAEAAQPFSRFVIPRETIATENPDKMNTMKDFQEAPEFMFKTLVEQVKDYAVFMLDTEGRVRSWNEGARRIKGYEAREIIGKHFSTFYSRQDVDAGKPPFELRMATEMGRYEEDGWRLRKDGSRFWANVVITPLRDEAGKLIGFAKVTRDLTQRKFQEDNLQKLLESEERFRLLVEQVKDYAIFILDAKGNVASWNQGARRIKGYSSDEIIGKHFSVFYTPEDLAADKPTRELSIAIREGRYEEEGWRVRKNGSRFWANVVITALWDKRGNLNGFAKVTRDLTDRKKEEDDLRQKTRELEAFAHTLSHDLRTPLRSIANFSQVLIDDATEITEQERQEYIGKISRSAQAMDNLIGDILKLSQLSIGQEPDRLESLEAAMDESISLLEAEIKETKAVVEIKKPLPDVLGNRTLLIQIFTNLIANALKFVPEGRAPKVEIYSKRINGDCEIHVQDAGVGIPEKYQQSIFNVFDRGEAPEDVIGTGVGLAIVKRAAERLGGSVRVKSKEGAGSDFIVTLSCPLHSPVEVSAG